MENKINIAELLKDCPRGMELDCTICNGVKFIELDRNPNFTIVVRANNGYEFSLTKYGQVHNIDDAKCVIFPKGKTIWEGFVPPCKFKDGDIVVADIFPFIYKDCDKTEIVKSYCGIDTKGNFWKASSRWTTLDKVTLATEEQKEKLFKAIKDNGYRWNAYTMTLEKLVEPKFKVGDRIKLKGEELFWVIKSIKDEWYICTNNSKICISEQHHYELASRKFNVDSLIPFESKVLVRIGNSNIWEGDIFVRYDKNATVNKFHCIGGWYKKCIPFKGNEWLLGTTDDCNDYYKTWKD